MMLLVSLLASSLVTSPLHAAAGARHTSPLLSTQQSAASSSSVVTFVNPLEVDGFAEPGGWGSHAEPSKLPLLVFLPGMDGSLATPFMQYAEVRRCLLHAQALFNEHQLTRCCVSRLAAAQHHV